MSRPKYLVACPTCGAPALEHCRSRTKGKTTDTHQARIQGQFDNPDRTTVIRRVLAGVYGNFLAEFLPDKINSRWEEPGYKEPKGNRDELMLLIWMNSSGGGTAEYAANQIRLAVEEWEKNNV